MRQLWNLSIACAFVAGTLSAQQHVGVTDVTWTNNSGAGSATLDARLHYPALLPGVDTRIIPAPTSAGFPVVVFLHGYGLVGNDYAEIGDALARDGYIAVMLNTSQWSHISLEADARAVFEQMSALTADPVSIYWNTFDMNRVGLLGHSMGGAVISYVLNADPALTLVNPGYRCGLALAPVDPLLAGNGAVIEVPLGLVSGQGDTLTPPANHAWPYYQAVTPIEGLKFHYEMGLACDHMNICGLTPNSPAVFARTQQIACGFFGQVLGSTLTGLEAVLGVDGQSDPNLATLEVDTSVPQAWVDTPLRIGQTSRVSVTIENGWGGLLGAASTAQYPTATTVGNLWLDESSTFTLQQGPVTGERMDVIIPVPNIMALVGTSFAVQGAGPTVNTPFILGSALGFEIGL